MRVAWVLLLLVAWAAITVRAANDSADGDVEFVEVEYVSKLLLDQEPSAPVEAAVSVEAEELQMPPDHSFVATDSQHTSSSSLEATMLAGVVSPGAMEALQRIRAARVAPAPADLSIQFKCPIPEPRVEGIKSMSCAEQTHIAPGSGCNLVCQPGYALVGKPYKCVEHPGLSSQLTGSQQCEPACPGLTDSFVSTLGAESAGGCKNPVAFNGRCGIACSAGMTFTGSLYWCNPATRQLEGSQTCTVKTEADKAARAERIANAANSKASKHSFTETAASTVVAASAPAVPAVPAAPARRPARKIFSKAAHLLATLEPLKPVTLDLLGEGDKTPAVAFAETRSAAQLFAKDGECDGQCVVKAAVTEVKPPANAAEEEKSEFDKYIGGLVDRLNPAKSDFWLNIAQGKPPIWAGLAVSRASQPNQGKLTGEFLLSGELQYHTLMQALKIGTNKLSEKVGLKDALVKRGLDEKTVVFSEKTEKNEDDICQKLPLQFTREYKVFAIRIDGTQMCFVQSPKMFGVYFAPGGLIQAFMPPPFNAIEGGGFALATTRALRFKEMAALSFGWGAEHKIVPQTCLSSPSYDAKDGGGCDGHAWVQINAEWSPWDVINNKFLTTWVERLKSVIDLKFEGRGTLFLDFQPEGSSGSGLSTSAASSITAAQTTLNSGSASATAAPSTALAPVGNTRSKGDKFFAFAASALKAVKDSSFSLTVDTSVDVSLTIGLFFTMKFNIETDARVYVQAGTRQKVPLAGNDESADGLYIQLKMGAGFRAGTKADPNAPGNREKLDRLKEKFKGAMRWILTRLGSATALSKKLQASPILMRDVEWKNEIDGPAISIQINGQGLSLIFAVGEKSVVFRVGLNGELEVCARWSSKDQCRGTNILTILSGAGKALGARIMTALRGAKKGTKAIGQYIVKAFAHENANKASTTHRIQQLPPGTNGQEGVTLVQRFDQEIVYVLTKEGKVLGSGNVALYETYLAEAKQWTDSDLLKFAVSETQEEFFTILSSGAKAPADLYSPLSAPRYAHIDETFDLEDTSDPILGSIVRANLFCATATQDQCGGQFSMPMCKKGTVAVEADATAPGARPSDTEPGKFVVDKAICGYNADYFSEDLNLAATVASSAPAAAAAASPSP